MNDFFSNQEEVDLLRPLEGLSELDLADYLVQGLGRLLLDSSEWVPAIDPVSFRGLVRAFLEADGLFVVDRQLTPNEPFSSATFNIVERGEVFIRLPYFEVLGASAGITRLRHKVLSALVHELRHFVTYQRMVTKLVSTGRSLREARTYPTRMAPKALALHILQMEDEAKVAESRLRLPQHQTLKKQLYSEVEAFRRWVQAFDFSTQPEVEIRRILASDPTVSRLVLRVVAAVSEFILAGKDGRPLTPVFIADLRSYRTAQEMYGDEFAYEYWIETAVVRGALSSIQGRISEKVESVFRDLISAQLWLHRRKIESNLRGLLELHPEIRSFDSRPG